MMLFFSFLLIFLSVNNFFSKHFFIHDIILVGDLVDSNKHYQNIIDETSLNKMPLEIVLKILSYVPQKDKNSFNIALGKTFFAIYDKKNIIALINSIIFLNKKRRYSFESLFRALCAMHHFFNENFKDDSMLQYYFIKHFVKTCLLYNPHLDILNSMNNPGEFKYLGYILDFLEQKYFQQGAYQCGKKSLVFNRNEEFFLFTLAEKYTDQPKAAYILFCKTSINGGTYDLKGFTDYKNIYLGIICNSDATVPLGNRKIRDQSYNPLRFGEIIDKNIKLETLKQLTVQVAFHDCFSFFWPNGDLFRQVEFPEKDQNSLNLKRVFFNVSKTRIPNCFYNTSNEIIFNRYYISPDKAICNKYDQKKVYGCGELYIKLIKN